MTTNIQLAKDIKAGSLSAAALLSYYCKILYELHGSYEAVARLTELDRRTVKKHVHMT